MRPLARLLTFAVAGIGLLMVMAVVLHPDTAYLPRHIEAYVPLTGALIGGLLTLFVALAPPSGRMAALPWPGRERLAWLSMALALLLWSASESWRLWLSLSAASGPPLAAGGSGAAPVLLVLGLLALPAASGGRQRHFLILDTTIALLSIVGIALITGLLVGIPSATLADAPARWLALYSSLSDLLLLAGGVLLLLRSTMPLYQRAPSSVCLWLLTGGLWLFALADLLQQIRPPALSGALLLLPLSAWLPLGQGLGLLLIGLAAHLRRSLPSAAAVEARPAVGLPPQRLLPYLLLGCLALLLLQALWQRGERQQFSALLVLSLALIIVLVRHLLTLLDQAVLRQQSGVASVQEIRQLETQLHSSSRRANALETAFTHLREVLGRLAAGDLSARAELASDEFLPLGANLNHLAEREMRLQLWSQQGEHLRHALDDLCDALERCPSGEPLIIPASCEGVPQIERLLAVTGLKQFAEELQAFHRQKVSLPPLLPPSLALPVPEGTVAEAAIEAQSTAPMQAVPPFEILAERTPPEDEQRWP